MSKLAITIDGHLFEVDLAVSPQCGGVCTATVNGESVPVIIPDLDTANSKMEWLVIDERPYELDYDDSLHWLRAYSGLHQVEVHDLEASVTRPRSGDGRIKAPIPGLITRVLVERGDSVKADQPLIVLEAMKMENEIRAPFDGVVRSVSTSPGQSVVRGNVLAEIE